MESITSMASRPMVLLPYGYYTIVVVCPSMVRLSEWFSNELCKYFAYEYLIWLEEGAFFKYVFEWEKQWIVLMFSYDDDKTNRFMYYLCF